MTPDTAAGVNVWGTPRVDVDAGGYCVECEREIPYHYDNCPIRKRDVSS